MASVLLAGVSARGLATAQAGVPRPVRRAGERTVIFLLRVLRSDDTQPRRPPTLALLAARIIRARCMAAAARPDCQGSAEEVDALVSNRGEFTFALRICVLK